MLSMSSMSSLSSGQEIVQQEEEELELELGLGLELGLELFGGSDGAAVALSPRFGVRLEVRWRCEDGLQTTRASRIEWQREWRPRPGEK